MNAPVLRTQSPGRPVAHRGGTRSCYECDTKRADPMHRAPRTHHTGPAHIVLGGTMYARTALITAALLAAALTGCASTHQQGTAERAATASKSSAKSPDCGPNSTLSQSDWIDKCSSASATPAAKQPATELAVGDTFAYNDGVKVTVTSIRRLTEFGEWDDHPKANQTGYRVTWTVRNGTKKPLVLDDWSESEQGATNGGEVTLLSVDKGSRTMTGRVAPGQTGTFTSESALDKSYGTKIVVTMTRMDNQVDPLAEDPHWTGTIK